MARTRNLHGYRRDWIGRTAGALAPAPKLKKGTNFIVGDVGGFRAHEPVQLWLLGADVGAGRVRSAHRAHGRRRTRYRGWDLSQTGKKLSVHIVGKWPEDGLKVETKSEVIKPGVFQHVFVTYDGSAQGQGREDLRRWRRGAGESRTRIN